MPAATAACCTASAGRGDASRGRPGWGETVTAPVFRLDPIPTGDVVVLDGDEGRHAAGVRRLRVGERIDLTDGRGTVVRGVVAAAERASLQVRVLDRRVVPPPSPRLVVAQALVKGERSELAVELLTELGVDEILPWEAERCVARWAGEKTSRRWAAAAEAAAKQARRPYWPVVGDVVRTEGLVGRVGGAGLAVLLLEEASNPLAQIVVPSAGDVLVIVGPEGGISAAERDAFSAAGVGEYLLGPTVLRASTAGAAAVAVLLAASGRW